MVLKMQVFFPKSPPSKIDGSLYLTSWRACETGRHDLRKGAFLWSYQCGRRCYSPS